MKAIFEREKLLSAFQTAASVAPSRSPKTILQSIKLEVGESSAVLMATDLEIGIRVEVSGVDCQAPGAAILPTGRVGALLRESSDEKLCLESDGQATVARGQRSEFKLTAENPDEFPQVASFNESSYHEMPARLLREIVRRTAFATDTESTRYALGGVLLELAGESIIAVGTDGRRLAKMEAPAHAVGGHQTGEGATIVPTKAMHLFERAISDNDAEIRLAARVNDVLVKSERATIYARLVEGRFPKWRDVFPSRSGVQRIELVAGPLLAAVRQAAIVTNEESLGVDFTFAEGKLTLAGLSAEGQSRVELPVAYDGPPLSIALNPKFMADFLKVLNPETTLALELRDAESAALCSTGDGYSYVIMPLARDR